MHVLPKTHTGPLKFARCEEALEILGGSRNQQANSPHTYYERLRSTFKQLFSLALVLHPRSKPAARS